MGYLNAIPDIIPGSIWTGEHGEGVRVISAAAKTVVYYALPGFIVPLLRGSALPLTMPEAEFRAKFRPLYDRAKLRSQFQMSLANLGEFKVFWNDDPTRFIARSISCTRHFAVPESARYVGTYADPCAAESFFDDLDEMLSLPDEVKKRLSARA